MRARFAREAILLQRVGAPHVPRFYGAGLLADGCPWIAMERLSGDTLAAEITARATSPDTEWVLRRAESLLEALAAVHAKGVVHRDLKPANVFITSGEDGRERLTLLDFGLADVPSDTSLSSSSGTSIAGTPLYMAPEQIRGDASIGPSADVYAFGVILFELLTGRTPFVGHASAVEHGHLALRPTRPSAYAAVPAPLEALALACLAKEPQRRPADAATVLHLLERTRQDEQPVSRGREDKSRVLGGGQQPVVLVLVETRAAMPAVIGAITSRHGIVARQRGSRYVAAFSARETDQPAAAAHAAATEIVTDLGGRAALRLSTVAIRRRESAPAIVSGPDVDRPETWAPAEPWSGIVLEPEVKRLLLGATSDAPPEAEVDTTVEIVEAPLLGRADEMAKVEEALRASLQGKSPTLVTIFGDTSLGKSRLSAEAARLAHSVDADTRVVVLRPGAQRVGEAPSDTVELLRAALDAPFAAPPDVIAFCKEKLGDAIGGETAHAIAVALRWQDLPHDGRFEQSLARAVAEGLRRRGKLGPIAVVLDDAHRADTVVLDALEAATLDGEGIALCVIAAASPRFEQLRPSWGARTQRYVPITLGPLDQAAMTELAAALLKPAEYPPADVLSLLATWSGQNPGCLTEIVRALKRAGAIRKQPNGESYYVATAEVEKLPASTAWQWLATRRLDALPPDAASFARLCAVLGAQFTRTELEWVQDAIERGGQAGTPVAAGFGLDTLVEREIVHRVDADRFAFETRMIREAIVDMVEPSQRAAIHRHALAYWKSRVTRVGATPASLEPLAEHAAACGELSEAADARLRLGELSLGKHKHVEADRHYSSALHLMAGPERRVRALLGRGKCRYRLHRPREAVQDLVAARAAGIMDETLLAEILLEEATALDWAEDFSLSAQRVDEAASMVDHLPSSPLEARVLVGEARSLMREGQMAGAIELLSRALKNKHTARDHDTHMIALVLLPVALVFAGRLDEAEQSFEDALDLATITQDWPHLSVTHSNRALLWGARKNLPRALEDMSRAVALAREIGNPFLERQATLNVAEILHWEGRRAEALSLAGRAATLERRFVESHVADSSLLMARILLADGDYREAAKLVAGTAKASIALTPTQRAFFRMLVNVLRDLGIAFEEEPEPDWNGLLVEARFSLLGTERLEVLYWRSRMAARTGLTAEANAAVLEARLLARDVGSTPQLGAAWPGSIAP